MNNVEITFPLFGFTYGTRTNIAARILNNKDAALFILAANGGVMKVSDIKGLLRGWRPFGENKKGVRFAIGELHFSYLFNVYYGHITKNYNAPEHMKHANRYVGCRYYSIGAYMWRPRHGYAAISSLGRARLNILVDQAKQAGICLENEVVAASVSLAVAA
jgi:hypothetical protein